MNYLVEDWGGKYQSQDISAKQGLGIAELLEKVLLEAELLELKANPNKRAHGSVVRVLHSIKVVVIFPLFWSQTELYIKGMWFLPEYITAKSKPCLTSVINVSTKPNPENPL